MKKIQRMTEEKRENNRKKVADASKECLGRRILSYCRSELYAQYPQMDLVFAAFFTEVSEQTETVGTDGSSLFFSPGFLIESYAKNPQAVLEGYFHLLLHCLYFHLQRPQQYEERLWNLACDIAVERIVQREAEKWEKKGKYCWDSLEKKYPDNLQARPCRESRQEEIRSCVWKQLSGQAISAEIICGQLENGVFSCSLEEMEDAFRFDDHRFWQLGKERQIEVYRKWEKIRKESGSGGSRAGGTSVGSGGGSFQETLEISKKSRGDYRKFLRQFAVLREERKLDLMSFDYIYYSYGMDHYGNIPLIEPLEYSEVNRLEELVIAIDTSGSCTSGMVEQFLAETYGILSEKENFFEKMNVYLIQCDCCIQNVRHITSRDDWEACGKAVEIQGRGGTDFRPVFCYIEKLKEKRALKNLRALIYFTDGDGIYPERRPEYETAFVSLGESKRGIYTPDWVRQMKI